MYRLVIACVLALVAALAGTALTKTPDQQPPSTETSCTGLSGAARGLWCAGTSEPRLHRRAPVHLADCALATVPSIDRPDA